MARPYEFQDQAEREWFTWWQVCKQLRARGIEPNDPKHDALIKAIKLWCEEAGDLDEQNAGDPIATAKRRDDARASYAPHVIGEWVTAGSSLPVAPASDDIERQEKVRERRKADLADHNREDV